MMKMFLRKESQQPEVPIYEIYADASYREGGERAGIGIYVKDVKSNKVVKASYVYPYLEGRGHEYEHLALRTALAIAKEIKKRQPNSEIIILVDFKPDAGAKTIAGSLGVRIEQINRKYNLAHEIAYSALRTGEEQPFTLQKDNFEDPFEDETPQERLTRLMNIITQDMNAAVPTISSVYYALQSLKEFFQQEFGADWKIYLRAYLTRTQYVNETVAKFLVRSVNEAMDALNNLKQLLTELGLLPPAESNGYTAIRKYVKKLVGSATRKE